MNLQKKRNKKKKEEKNQHKKFQTSFIKLFVAVTSATIKTAIKIAVPSIHPVIKLSYNPTIKEITAETINTIIVESSKDSRNKDSQV